MATFAHPSHIVVYAPGDYEPQRGSPYRPALAAFLQLELFRVYTKVWQPIASDNPLVTLSHIQNLIGENNENYGYLWLGVGQQFYGRNEYQESAEKNGD
ncbi:hypothetical protein YERSI8AC_240095 [Enterobacterales bacterium 8AC]|nr:hypothetical protein YERSI8AC_240095 [Enterobacterales bacterium 8AC]